MCTILILLGAHRAAPLIVAANRDEFFDRPASEPEVLHSEAPRAIGGRDLRHGGTWMGLNQAGLFVGLTNIRSAAADRRSRGEVVLSILSCRHPDEAESRLLTLLATGRYRPFNLVFGTVQEFRIAYVQDHGVQIEPVPQGLHVLVSSGVLDDPSLPKVMRARRLLDEAARSSSGEDLLDSLKTILKDHHHPAPNELPPALLESPLGADFESQLQAICVHTEVYGTRSATVALVGGGKPLYEFCQGPPCRGQWRPYGELLEWDGGAYQVS